MKLTYQEIKQNNLYIDRHAGGEYLWVCISEKLGEKELRCVASSDSSILGIVGICSLGTLLVDVSYFGNKETHPEYFL